jgi:hypothetical protein
MEIPSIPPARSGSYPTPAVQSSSPNFSQDKKLNLVEGINLKMTAKGKYYWDINAYGDLDERLVFRISEMNRILKAEFPGNTSTSPDE